MVNLKFDYEDELKKSILTIDHGANSKRSKSWSVPYPRTLPSYNAIGLTCVNIIDFIKPRKSICDEIMPKPSWHKAVGRSVDLAWITLLAGMVRWY